MISQERPRGAWVESADVIRRHHEGERHRHDEYTIIVSILYVLSIRRTLIFEGGDPDFWSKASDEDNKGAKHF
jgi:hypothetical protein